MWGLNKIIYVKFPDSDTEALCEFPTDQALAVSQALLYDLMLRTTLV